RRYAPPSPSRGPGRTGRWTSTASGALDRLDALDVLEVPRLVGAAAAALGPRRVRPAVRGAVLVDPRVDLAGPGLDRAEVDREAPAVHGPAGGRGQPAPRGRGGRPAGAGGGTRAEA